MTDESWPMIEEAVFRLFDEISRGRGDVTIHVTVGPRLAELGWMDIETAYPVESRELLFRAQGRALAQTECLDRVILGELASAIGEPVDGLVLPSATAGCRPSSTPDRVDGIVFGDLRGQLAVPVSQPSGAVWVGVVSADLLDGHPLDTMDPSVHWTKVNGSFGGRLVEASAQWERAVAAASRALATEIVELAGTALVIAVEHTKVRVQFGVPIGSFQSPRHSLAHAAAKLEGARALLRESWRCDDTLTALAAKSAASDAHRVVADAAMQVCGAVGLTAEHQLHRYIVRGFQLGSLWNSPRQLDTAIAQLLFDTGPAEMAQPLVVG